MTLGELNEVCSSARTIYMVFTDEGEFVEEFTVNYIEKGRDFEKNIIKKHELIRRGVEVECVSANQNGWLEIMLITY